MYPAPPVTKTRMHPPEIDGEILACCGWGVRPEHDTNHPPPGVELERDPAFGHRVAVEREQLHARADAIGVFHLDPVLGSTQAQDDCKFTPVFGHARIDAQVIALACDPENVLEGDAI